MGTVTKRDIVTRISEKRGLPQRDVHKIIDQMIVELTTSLSSGDEVVMRNFGTFEIATNQPKIGRNPKQPEIDIVIPMRKVAKFRPGKLLRKRVLDSKRDR